MRKIGSTYVHGYSTDLLKVKVCFLHLPFLFTYRWYFSGKTRWHRSSCTRFEEFHDFFAIVCSWKKNLQSLNSCYTRPQGGIFQIPKHQSPFLVHKGDITTIAYDSFKRQQLPVDPVIVCKRNDLSWDDVVINNTKKQVALNCMLYIVLMVCCTI